MLVVHHVFVPTPDTSVAVHGFDGPFVSANTAGVKVENTIIPTRVLEIIFLKFPKNEIFINLRMVRKYVIHYFLLFSNITINT